MAKTKKALDETQEIEATPAEEPTPAAAPEETTFTPQWRTTGCIGCG